MKRKLRTTAVVAAIVALLSFAASTQASAVNPDDARAKAAPAYASYPLKPNSVGASQLTDNGIGEPDLGPVLRKKIFNGIADALVKANAADVKASNPAGKVTGLESDGPYPGATELKDGDNSTAYWKNDGKLQRSWVMCPAGKVALGGGFTLASDASVADKVLTHVTASAPIQVKDGDPDTYAPITGDVDGSFVPNGWLVEGVYTGTNDALIVRPHVVCANVAK